MGPGPSSGKDRLPTTNLQGSLLAVSFREGTVWLIKVKTPCGHNPFFNDLIKDGAFQPRVGPSNHLFPWILSISSVCYQPPSLNFCFPLRLWPPNPRPAWTTQTGGEKGPSRVVEHGGKFFMGFVVSNLDKKPWQNMALMIFGTFWVAFFWRCKVVTLV